MRRRTRLLGFTLIELMVAVFITAVVLSMGYGAVNQALQNREALAARAERLQAVQTTMRLITQDFTQLVPRPVRQPLGDGYLPALLSGTSMNSSLGSTISTLSTTNPISTPTSSGFGSSSNSGIGSSNSGLGADTGGLGLGAGNSAGTSSPFGSTGLGSGTPPSGSSANNPTSPSTSTSTNSASSLTKGPITLVTFTHTGWANPAGIQRPALQRVTYILEEGTLRREHWPELDATMTTPTVKRELLDKVKSVTLRYMDVSFNWRDQWPPQALAGDPNANLRLRPIAVEVTLELEDWGAIVRVIEIAA